MSSHNISIGNAPLQLADLDAVHTGDFSLTLHGEAHVAVRRSRKTILDVLERGQPVYGVNTGFGKLANRHIEPDALAELQLNLVRSHAAGTGSALAAGDVRLLMLLKLQALTRGFSGVRECVIDTLVGLLEQGIIPVIPRQGSVGASGDLAPLAHLALVLIGEGEATINGERMSGRQALQHAGLQALRLEAKEGLALLNGTQVSTALALSALFGAHRNLQAAVLIGCMSTDALLGSDAPFDARIHALRPHGGQIDIAARYRQLFDSSAIRASHVNCKRVQDPYSFRCQPQVMGACLDLLRHVLQTLLIEANAVTDNPLIFADEGEALSGGNFHAEPVAFAADMMALAIAETGSISERRIAALIDPAVSDLPAFLTTAPGLNSGYMMAHVTAAALASENKQLATPASVDSLPTSANQEDHVSMATHAAWRLKQMNDNTAGIIAIELLAAADGIEFRRPLASSQPIEQAHAVLRRHVARRTRDRVFADDIASARALLGKYEFSAAVGDLLDVTRSQPIDLTTTRN